MCKSIFNDLPSRFKIKFIFSFIGAFKLRKNSDFVCELCLEEFCSTDELQEHIIQQHDIENDWRRFFQDWIGYTNGDMFIDLIEKGHSPTHLDYNKWVYKWLQDHILEKKPCNWLQDYSTYFSNYVSLLIENEKIFVQKNNMLYVSLIQHEKLFKPNSNEKNRYLCHDGFFNKIIDTLITFDHSCPKCSTGTYYLYCMLILT